MTNAFLLECPHQQITILWRQKCVCRHKIKTSLFCFDLTIMCVFKEKIRKYNTDCLKM